MPELPEVETIKRGLQKKIIGLKINRVKLYSSKLSPKEAKLSEGQKVLKIWRRAKVLGVELDKGLTLLFHLKMTGQLIYISGKDRVIGGHPTLDMVGKMPNRHTRVVFNFQDGSKLFFNDQRKFGWIKLIENSKLQIENFLSSFGPEPLGKDFTTKVLKKNLLRHKSLSVKVALLDQKVVAGLGNIYVCEALFNAGINPKRKVSTLTNPQFRKLHQGIIEALSQGIKHGGSSREHFVNVDGARGYFLDKAFVYGRENRDCRNCQGKIEKTMLAGRGTFFCENCQR